MLETERQRMTTWRMRFECWIPNATDRHSEYVILIAFPLKQWLNESTSLVRYTYIASIVEGHGL